MATKSTAPKAFGESETDRRISGLADRRVNASTYRFEEWPKAVYRLDKNGAILETRTVGAQEDFEKLGEGWSDETPDVHSSLKTHEQTVLRGDGVNPNLGVQKVEVVNPEDTEAGTLTPAEKDRQDSFDKKRAADQKQAQADRKAADDKAAQARKKK